MKIANKYFEMLKANNGHKNAYKGDKYVCKNHFQYFAVCATGYYCEGTKSNYVTGTTQKEFMANLRTVREFPRWGHRLTTMPSQSQMEGKTYVLYNQTGEFHDEATPELDGAHPDNTMVEFDSREVADTFKERLRSKSNSVIMVTMTPKMVREYFANQMKQYQAYTVRNYTGIERNRYFLHIKYTNGETLCVGFKEHRGMRRYKALRHDDPAVSSMILISKPEAVLIVETMMGATPTLTEIGRVLKLRTYTGEFPPNPLFHYVMFNSYAPHDEHYDLKDSRIIYFDSWERMAMWKSVMENALRRDIDFTNLCEGIESAHARIKEAQEKFRMSGGIIEVGLHG